jgi:GMP synthase (glutamine-hydrolysing)
MHQTILIIDFGSQYTQLIARRLRELNVYCEIHPFNHLPEINTHVKGIIFSGSPFSVRDHKAPYIETNLYMSRVPILGLCYGAQLLAHQHAGEVVPSNIREYGRAVLNITYDDIIFHGVNDSSQVWMSHADTIQHSGEDFEIIARTEDIPVAAFKHKQLPVYGFQFHPEVYHSTEGKTMIKNFAYTVCGCTGDWTPASFVEETVNDLKVKLGNDKVILGLSGGVDSSVAALLLHKAIGSNLYCIFIDNGLLRKNEAQHVMEVFKPLGLNIQAIDASQEFYQALKGITDPEQKRKTIGRVFIEVFERVAHDISDVSWLAQGTIYPDVIESVSVKGPSATIKSHHNVGGLPDVMKLKIVEPLRSLFKDEVRRVGKALGLREELLNRHPFPGPGLGIRILGDIDETKVKMLQDADDIYIKLLHKHHLYQKVWQAGAIFLPVNSVGVMGDERTYENAVCLRAVTSTDGMTADWAHLPYEFMSIVSNEIINKVKGINRVVYDISSKPPATIEWE